MFKVFTLYWHIYVKAQSCSTLCDLMDYTVHGILQVRILEWVAFPFSRGSSQPRDRTQASSIAGRFFLPAEPQGKPKKTGVGSLSLPQQIFPTQESNWGLLHCRRILYQLSYQIEKSLWRFKEGCPAGTCRWGSLRSRLHLQSPWNPLGGREGRKTGLTEKLSSEVASVVASLWGL